MRILFLTPTLPFPPVGGEKLRPFYFLKYLSLKHKVSLFAFIERKEELRAIKNCPFDIDIHTVLLPKWHSYLKVLRGLFSFLPLEVYYYASSKMQKLIYRELNNHKFDLIFCHLIRMAHYIQDDIRVKKVIDISDALSLRYYLSSCIRSDFFKVVERIESDRLKQYEPKIIRKFDWGFIASSKDKEYFSNNLNLKELSLLPNGVQIEGRFSSEASLDLKRIVFFGNMRPFPNRDAFFYFYKEIFPLIKEKIREVRLILVGANINKNILSLAKRDPFFSVHNNVADIKPFVQDAAVSVAPMRVAVGIQNKIIQSMAYGLPVVTTTIGLGGIDACPNRDILLADDPVSFSSQVISLIQDAKLRNYIIDNAYRLIKAKYQWQEIVNKLDAECLKIIS